MYTSPEGMKREAVGSTIPPRSHEVREGVVLLGIERSGREADTHHTKVG